MKFFLCLSVLVALIASGRAGPTSPLLAADAREERESEDSNEVGPPEDWKLMGHLSKTASAFDPTDSEEQSRALAKEVREFARLAQQSMFGSLVNGIDVGDNATANATTTESDNDVDSDDVVTEPDVASSDWIGTAWRNPQDGVVVGASQSDSQTVEGEDGGGNFEDIIRKISNDLKILYVKVKQVMTVVKNWINAVRGHRSGIDKPYTMSSSASESDGVFVIADPLIGDVDKSNKYTVPIHAD